MISHVLCGVSKNVHCGDDCRGSEKHVRDRNQVVHKAEKHVHNVGRGPVSDPHNLK
jgi:hypothetical protein